MTELVRFGPCDSASDICDVIRRDGAAIILERLSPEICEQALAEAAPLTATTAKGFDTFSGYQTTRSGGLIAAMPTARQVATDPLVLEVASQSLAPWCTRIQLHITQLIRIMPGEVAQMLHRDRAAFGNFLNDPIIRAMEPQINTIWALTPFTAANGATLLAPGSQNWEYGRKARTDELTAAEMPVGSALVFTGSVIHGGGANSTERDRLGLNIDYCLGWLRQAENQYLSCPPNIARTLSPELQDLLGYTMGHFGLGYYSPSERFEGMPGTMPPEFALGRLPATIIGIADHAPRKDLFG